MLEATRQLLLERIRDEDVVLDIGGWGDPFERADWVIDIAPYDTRGFYERAGWKEPGSPPAEQFTKDSWIERDICDREPYPFGDGEVDFVICSQTLEDVRDPLWVCSEINRIGKAGYIEVPSRLEEQSWGVDGTLVGRHHHHWLIDVHASGLDFVFKRHDIHTRPEFYFPPGFWATLSADERVQRLWWKDSFSYRERILFFEEGTDEDGYFAGFVSRERSARDTRVSRVRTLIDRYEERALLRTRRRSYLV